jgi:hypothetical protein
MPLCDERRPHRAETTSCFWKAGVCGNHQIFFTLGWMGMPGFVTNSDDFLHKTVLLQKWVSIYKYRLHKTHPNFWDSSQTAWFDMGFFTNCLV